MVDFDGKLFFAPMDGEVLDLTECVDPIFSQGIVGAGILIIPSGSKVYAPCDGTVSIIANCRHGIAIKNPAGFQVLIHIGIDTVEMDGDGFKSFKKAGDEVKCGDLLISHFHNFNLIIGTHPFLVLSNGFPVEFFLDFPYADYFN